MSTTTFFQVRDSLYRAWRDGHLNVAVDDDGKPITIPPIKLESSVNLDSDHDGIILLSFLFYLRFLFSSNSKRFAL